MKQLFLSVLFIFITSLSSVQAGNSPSFCLDEAENKLGANKCSTNAECDGARTCSSSGWCQGDAGHSNPVKGPEFCYIEAKNKLGAHKCNNDSECTGNRTCSQWNWCQGKSGHTTITDNAPPIIPVVAAAQSALEPNTCLFFEHWDYKGEHFGIYNGHVLKTQEIWVPNRYTQGKDYQNWVAPKWAGRVSSLKVPPGCIAEVTNGWRTASLLKNLPRFTEEWNDKSIGFGCICK